MAVTPEAYPVPAVASAANRARDGLAQIAQTFLVDRRDPVGAVSAVMALAAEIGQVRVGCRDEGTALTVRFWREPEQIVELPLARSWLRMMCANLAVRSSHPNQPPPLYGGIVYLPPLEPGNAGFTLKLMNTMGEHWFDLAYQGKVSPLDAYTGDVAVPSAGCVEVTPRW